MTFKNFKELIYASLFSEDENRDYTALPISSALILLSVPMVLEMFFEALFALVDAFFVAKYVGVYGVAMVGISESVMTLIYSLAWGLAMAATAVVSRRTGEKDYLGARQSTFQVIMISVVIGAIIGIPGYIFSEEILGLMGAESAVIETGLWYAKLQFLSGPIVILLFSLGGALRGAGFALAAMKAVIIANLINIGLDYLFVGILHLGVKGAALATIIGRSCGIFLQLRYLLKGFNWSEILLRFKLDFGLISNIIKIASGSTGQFLIQSASWVFMVRIIATFGSEVVAGYTIALRVIIFTILPSWGLANTASTLLGQNMGAQQIDKGVRTVWTVALLNMTFMAFVSVLFFLFGKEMISLFDSNNIVVQAGTSCLRIMAIGYIIFGLGMVIMQAINGAGDTLPPTIFNVVCYWMIQLPLGYYLPKLFSHGEDGVYYAIIIAESIWTVIGVWYFNSGRWKKVKV
ncbi:MAG TPA: MATE family efflux transporter [Saprospiraceae bacterium]|mgnify:FL=1|nr:MATE family efflux transporter [Saprospiraceae bacterium]